MKKSVIFNHSAAIDDFVATAVVNSMENIELLGIIVTNADCIAEPAMTSSSRVHQLLGLEAAGVPLALSKVRGWNSFPWEYKKDCITIGTIDALNPYKSNLHPPYGDGDLLLRQLLHQALAKKEQVSILCTGPITTIAQAIIAEPALADAVGEIIWMGGAVYAKGNLDGKDPSKPLPPGAIPEQIANPHAEWNAFWDPFAVDAIFKTFSKVKCFPLDITDKAKISEDFKKSLAQQAKTYKLSQFVHQAYALVDDEPFYEMWNTCAAINLGTENEAIFKAPSCLKLKIDLWGDDKQGTIHPTEEEANIQEVFIDFKDTEAFYKYVLQLLRKN